jgi:uncharacterized protein
MKTLGLFLALSIPLHAGEITATGIPLDAPWKKQVYEYARKNVVHSIWGIAHSERDYQVAVKLGEREKVSFSGDVLFAAAFLHDLGAIEPFRVKGMDHAVRSAELALPLLLAYGLPLEMIARVQHVILGHMYDPVEKPLSIEAVLFHDADTLDFLGTIGVIRIVGLTDRHGWAPDLPGALSTLKDWTDELPGKFITESAKREAKWRSVETNFFLESLDKYTFNGSAI